MAYIILLIAENVNLTSFCSHSCWVLKQKKKSFLIEKKKKKKSNPLKNGLNNLKQCYTIQ